MRRGLSVILVIGITVAVMGALATGGWYYLDRQNNSRQKEMQTQIDDLQKQLKSNTASSNSSGNSTATSANNSAGNSSSANTATSSNSADIFSLENLKKASYLISDYSGAPFNLTDGVYANNNSGVTFTLDTTVIGYHKNSAGENDAAGVILKMSTGGTGVEKYLVLMNRKGDLAISGGAVDLGDRVQVNSITLSDQLHLTVNFLGFAPTDPSCCPSQNTTQTYKWVSGTKLTLDN